MTLTHILKQKWLSEKTKTIIFCLFFLFPLILFSQNRFFPKISSYKNVQFGFYQPESILTFNPVDGLKIRPGGKINWLFNNRMVWENSLALGYSVNQDEFIFHFSTYYEYLPEKRGRVGFSFGRESADFNLQTGVNPLGNALGCLLLKNSSVNFYNRSYLTGEHHLKLFDGFNTKIAFYYESREELFNSSDFSILFRHSRFYPENIPNNAFLLLHPDAVEGRNGAGFSIEISYTPFQNYNNPGREKLNSFSFHPTFQLLWKKGISNIFNSNSDYDYLQFSVSQKIGKESSRGFSYHLSAGWFPNNRQMHFSEYRHSRVYVYPLTLADLYQTFHTMSVYYPSTNEWFVEGFFKYEFHHLALKFIPGLNRTKMTESLYLSYFTNPIVKNYLEIGYSLNSILRFFNVGVFVGFENGRYANFIYKIDITLNPKN